ncbi:MAG: NAD(P)-dependent oxidoreductase, partial [Deltaproteobacteria bacterium]|nr:NAD(P)-dependent oxidoreductase [Deltaproteobacteria bacterium]
SVVTRILLNQGHQVRVLDSLLYGGKALLGLYPDQNFSFIRGDIREVEVVKRALDGSEAVVHLAAIVGDPACARQATLAREINLDASLRLFDLCQHEGVKRFVFASTCSNYGKMADSSDYVSEDSELRPVSLYAESKVSVEKTLLSFPSRDGVLPVTTALRFATLFGLSPRMRFDLTVNEFTMELLTKRRLVVYGGQFWRPYIHVRDASRAIAMVLDAPPDVVRGQVFNVGETSQNFQKSRLVELIRTQMDGQVKIEYVHKEEDPRDYRVSFEKVKRGLSFQVTRTVTDGIREIIDAIAQGVITDFDNPDYRN